MAQSKVYSYVMSRIYVDAEEFKRIRSGYVCLQVAPGNIQLTPEVAAQALPDADFSYPGDKYMTQMVEILLRRGKNEVS